MADFMKHTTKTKKYGTRKTSDGVQLWSSQKFRTEKSKKLPQGVSKEVARKIGAASADAFMLQGAMEGVAQYRGTKSAKKRLGKPMGGK